MIEIIKIGGSTLTDLKILDKIVESFCKQNCSNKVFVVSAFKNYTDDLIRMNNYFSQKQSSFVITSGEQITAGLFAVAFEKYGKKAIPLAAWQVPIIKKDNGKIKIDSKKILKYLSQGIIPIITGFQCINENFEIQDLGRGGSDLTAVLLAQKLNSNCTIVKEFAGINSVDPALFSEGFIWKNVDYDNMINFANAGGKVVQSGALEIAKKSNVNIKVTDVLNSNSTIINKTKSQFWSIFKHENKIRMVNSKKNIMQKNLGFSFQSYLDFYDFDTIYDNITLQAKKIYDVYSQIL